LDSQYSVEVLIEHQLSGRMAEYPLIVIPEWDYLKPGFKKELLDYVQKGGKLLLVGPKAAAMFKKPLRIRLLGKPLERKQWLEHDGWLCGVKSISQRVRLAEDVKCIGKLYTENDTKGPFEHAATITNYGKGVIAAIYINLGERYCCAQTTVVRDFLRTLVHRLFPRPIVEVTGSRCVDVVANRKDGKLLINLINTGGPHADPSIYTFDEVPSIGPLHVSIRTRPRPSKVLRAPSGRKLKFTYNAGKVRLTLPKLKLHDIIVIQ
jgi:hypothetical protein